MTGSKHLSPSDILNRHRNFKPSARTASGCRSSRCRLAPVPISMTERNCGRPERPAMPFIPDQCRRNPVTSRRSDARALRRISPANNRCGLLGVVSLHFVGFVAERLVSRRSYAARHNRPAFRVSVALRVESVSPAGGPHPKHSFSFGLCTS